MNESGCIVTVEMKFSLHTTFLDRIFISQGIIQEGETRMDAILRVNKELEETAARLRKEAGAQVLSPVVGPPLSQVIDYKNIELIERAIDDSKTLEDLRNVKNAASNAGLISQYMTKLKELSV